MQCIKHTQHLYQACFNACITWSGLACEAYKGTIKCSSVTALCMLLLPSRGEALKTQSKPKTRLLSLTIDNCFCSRKTLVLLILTLNHIYPDYDFSLLRAHHFRKEDGIATVEAAIDGHLLEVSKVGQAACVVRSQLCEPVFRSECCRAEDCAPHNM